MALKTIAFLVLFSIYLQYIYCQTPNTVKTDFSLCTCDLTISSCDINCCCDKDCSDAIKQGFSSCTLNSIITNDHVCSYQQITYDASTKQAKNSIGTSSNGFCIYKTNVAADPYEYKTQAYDAKVNLTAIIVSKQVNYTTLVTGEPSTNINQSTTNTTTQYPTGFQLSGNIGYLAGKPVMKAMYNNGKLLLNNDPNQWWTVIGGDNCDTSSVRETVKFGVNMVAGCWINPPATCEFLSARVNQYIDSDTTMANYRIATFAKVNLTNPYDWVSVVVKNKIDATGNCKVLTMKKFEVLYVKVGRTEYLHNKIIGVRSQEVWTSTAPIYFTNVVNFIDATGSKLVAAKLSPFLNIALPYDFFSPILPT